MHRVLAYAQGCHLLTPAFRKGHFGGGPLLSTPKEAEPSADAAR